MIIHNNHLDNSNSFCNCFGFISLFYRTIPTIPTNVWIVISLLNGKGEMAPKCEKINLHFQVIDKYTN